MPINIKEDFASGRAAFVDASKHLESVNLAPDGQRAIVVARGDLFSVPAKDGTPRNLTQTPRMHTSATPSGRRTANGSPITPMRPARTSSMSARRTAKASPNSSPTAADTYYYQPIWSPDSKKLLWSDRLQRLRYVDVASKAVTEVDSG